MLALGAATGIGRALCERLLATGGRVIAVDINPARVEAINSRRSPVEDAEAGDEVRIEGHLPTTPLMRELFPERPFRLIEIDMTSSPVGDRRIGVVEDVRYTDPRGPVRPMLWGTMQEQSKT